MIIHEHEQYLMLICMFRYALGRHSYVVGWCVEIIERNWQCLTKLQQKQIRHEIDEHYAIYPSEEKDLDRRTWERIFKLPVKEQE